MTWPGALVKPSRTARKKREHEDAVALERHEREQKVDVRNRDKRCRFPLCGCHRLKLHLEVSHNVHKGMGGDPTGDRSWADAMIYLCDHRHQYGAVSRHKGTLRVKALTKAGMNGPVAWDVDVSALPASMRGGNVRWFEVARERSVGIFEAFTQRQEAILRTLREMEI